MSSNPIHVQGVPFVLESIIVSIHCSCLKGKKRLIHPKKMFKTLFLIPKKKEKQKRHKPMLTSDGQILTRCE